MHGSERDSIAVGHSDGYTAERASLGDHLAARYTDDGGKRRDFDSQLVGDQREQLHCLRRLVRSKGAERFGGSDRTDIDDDIHADVRWRRRRCIGFAVGHGLGITAGNAAATCGDPDGHAEQCREWRRHDPLLVGKQRDSVHGDRRLEWYPASQWLRGKVWTDLDDRLCAHMHRSGWHRLAVGDSQRHPAQSSADPGTQRESERGTSGQCVDAHLEYGQCDFVRGDR